MSKIYKNHVFRRTTLPWQWLAAISFAIAMLASIGAYVSARSWVAEGRYLQSLDIAQIEVLRLVPALKDLQKQTTGTSALDSEFFANLKKTDRLLKSMTDDIKKPADAAAKLSANARALPCRNSASLVAPWRHVYKKYIYYSILGLTFAI